MIAVVLTRAEALWVGWALGAVEGYFHELKANGEIVALPRFPSLDGHVLFWPEPIDPEVVEDLEYRLTVQAVDVVAAELHHAAKLRAVRSAWRAIAAKILDGAA